MVLLDILFALLLIFGLVVLVVLGVIAWLTLPASDMVNRFLRRVGLAGASPETRAIGERAVGTVDQAFVVTDGVPGGRGKVFVGGETWNAHCPEAMAPALAPGDEVEVSYDTHLTVSVIGKTIASARRSPTRSGGQT